jgi:hypothetical protein
MEGLVLKVGEDSKEYSKVYISMKQAGKRKDYIKKEEIKIPVEIDTLSKLITFLVKDYVFKYNNLCEGSIKRFLSNNEIENQADTGKVGFGGRYNEKNAEPQNAVSTALLAFSDGLYRVYVCDVEITSLDSALTLRDGDILTFIRFTMLAGSMW